MVRRLMAPVGKVAPPRRKWRSGVRSRTANTANKAEARKSGGEQYQGRRFGNPFHQRQDRVADERFRRRSRVNSVPEQILRRIARGELGTRVGYIRQSKITRVGHGVAE